VDLPSESLQEILVVHARETRAEHLTVGPADTASVGYKN
jgi:hypothetical protein